MDKRKFRFGFFWCPYDFAKAGFVDVPSVQMRTVRAMGKAPDDFQAVGQFYQDFTQVEDEEALKLLEQVRKTS